MILLMIHGCFFRDLPERETNAEVILSFLFAILVVYMISSFFLLFVKKEEAIN